MKKVELKPFNLCNPDEWNEYLELFLSYDSELECQEEHPEMEEFLKSDEYKNNIIRLTIRKTNPFNISRILFDKQVVGFIDYICYVDEEGKCVIGNFFIYPTFRNKGIGTKAYLIVESYLKESGGEYIELTPEEKALSLYRRAGYQNTGRRSPDNGIIIYRKKI